MLDPGVGGRASGAGLREPGLIDFVGEKFPVPAQGDSIHLSTRVYLDSHQLHSISGRELKP